MVGNLIRNQERVKAWRFDSSILRNLKSHSQEETYTKRRSIRRDMSHIKFQITTPSNPHPTKRIERVQDAVCAAKKAGPGAQIISVNTNNPRVKIDVTAKAMRQFGSRRCR